MSYMIDQDMGIMALLMMLLGRKSLLGVWILQHVTIMLMQILKMIHKPHENPRWHQNWIRKTKYN